MHITFYGAAQTVTGSRHVVEVSGQQFLLECGLFQGRRKETYSRNLNFPFEPKEIEAVILSHAHIDHSGNLPNLVKQGFTGPIHCTRATHRLAEIMLMDSGHIQEYDVRYVNKKRARRGEAPLEPLYTQADAQRTANFFQPQELNQPFDVIPGVKATLVEAGHILGSAGVVLDLEEKGRKRRVMFSGDIGRVDLPILRDPVLPHDVDILIMECTYGNRNHHPPQRAYEQLRETVRRTLERKGKVIIPAFAVGRTQTLVYYLHRMFDKGEVPRVPVFVDSPLAINVTEIFRKFPECFDEEARRFMREDPHGQALGFDLLTFTRSVEESKAINDVQGSAIIISASGMAETGRILHHLRNNIHNPRNTVLITSWMAPHTLGRRLLEGSQSIKIFGEAHDVRAEVVTINGLSAHADQQFLLDYASAVKDRVETVYLVHGEKDAAEALMEKMRGLGFEDVQFPDPGTKVEI